MIDTTKELPSCPVQVTLSLIDNKWKMLILGEILFEGTQRFSELRKALPAISQKVLTQNLRSMEADGLIVRKVFAEVPPRVEYSITDLGSSLRPVIDSLMKWGEEYKSNLENKPQQLLLTIKESPKSNYTFFRNCEFRPKFSYVRMQ